MHKISEKRPRGILRAEELLDHAVVYGAVVGPATDLCGHGIDPAVDLSET